MSCACCVEQRLSFALQKVGKGRLTLKKEQLSAIRSAYDQVDAFAWLLTGFGKSIEYLQVFTFLFQHTGVPFTLGAYKFSDVIIRRK